MGLLTFANYKEYSISLQLNSPVIICLLLEFAMYRVPMSNYISQCGLYPNLLGPLEPILRSKEALQIQVRIINFLVMEPLVWYIVNKCDKWLNSSFQFIRSLVTLEPSSVSRMYLILFFTVCRLDCYFEPSNIYFGYVSIILITLHRTVYRQPPFNFINYDKNRHEW